ncbi:HD domain-containing phosphohydrolase [Leptolyngbya sp. 7M]|uniref:HD domain-containing phosphohydrolase n=1 Tax=Leptolyngbya sp. 7M TaxID=2812896 RepID=UPI001B8C2A06|nr:HD domain-containing phosphohydrolase [Leptolyngbya sp. 7M]QYO66036.1 HD domain-containing protein [Leptolyngbya sp. 7M]
MSQKRLKISLIYFVVFALLLVGLVPIMLVGWFLAGRSATELRAVENRYQIQLVQEKARQIEMFGQRYRDMVTGLADAFALSNNPEIFASPLTDQQLSNTLKENPDLVALYVMPRDSESLALYRPGKIARQEIDSMAGKAIESISNADVNFGEPQIVASGGEPVITISAPVNVGETRIASVVAIVSLKRIGRDVVGMDQTSEKDLWLSGLPIVFVVDSTGRAVFHPDFALVKERRPLSHLKIVEEWRDSYQQFQSGLVPFSAEFDGVSHDMIGAYSTVSIGPNTQFGVLTMQDEARALASVGEMRTQTWLISLAFALLALLIGSIAARSLTAPILHLSAAAEKISGGDLSTRVEARNITEIGTLGESFNTMADKLEEHIAKLAKAAAENRELFVGTVKALAAAIDGKDKYTRGHSERVARISVAIGKQMNLPEDELETLRISALLHDVGKIAIDDNILKKPAALTPEEFEIMKTHPVKGYKIMSQIPAMREFLPGMYMHHEMVNGEGYPQGLIGDQIPLQAKIVSVADTFDAMTIDRPYSKGMQLQEALDRIRQLVGTRYDGAVVEALVRGCNAGEIGRGVVQSMAAAEKAGEVTINAGVAKGLGSTSKADFTAESSNIIPPPPPDIIQQNDLSN